MKIFVGRNGEAYRATVHSESNSHGKQKKVEDKRVDILHHCISEWRYDRDLARCCGHLHGLTPQSKKVIGTLIDEGLLLREGKPCNFVRHRGREGLRYTYRTTEAGKTYLCPSYQVKRRRAKAQHKCKCGSFLKKTDTVCKRCFSKMAGEDRAKVIQAQILQELLDQIAGK